MGNALSLAFPPAPSFTETSLPNLKGKVYIVTGATAGVGKELSRLLYSRNATVYLGTRSPEKTSAVISWIRERHPSSKGKLVHLHLVLNDLDGIKSSADAFLAQETRLDILFNNAGIMRSTKGAATTKQGYEEHLGVNCIAPFLLTKLLTPLLLATAKKEENKGSVRVVWVASIAASMAAPIDMQNVDFEKEISEGGKYVVSKGGNVLHAVEYRRRYAGEGVVSVSLHPGMVASDMVQNLPAWQYSILKFFMHPPVYGAYTALFAGFAPEVASLDESDWVVAWGRVMKLRKEYYSEKGKENAKAFWEWCEKQVKRFT